jgi:catechol 2,3-dioxygenase-like lactoylglutathione lyase family enzyme
MLDHLSLAVSDVKRARAFYDRALAPLGVSVLMSVPDGQGGEAALGYGSDGRAYFWIGGGQPPTGRLHVAFDADSRALVDAFYAAAIEAGGRDNGPPGLRAHYDPDYYGAFVFDPDGHNVEAVCRRPPPA